MVKWCAIGRMSEKWQAEVAQMQVVAGPEVRVSAARVTKRFFSSKSRLQLFSCDDVQVVDKLTDARTQRSFRRRLLPRVRAS